MDAEENQNRVGKLNYQSQDVNLSLVCLAHSISLYFVFLCVLCVLRGESALFHAFLCAQQGVTCASLANPLPASLERTVIFELAHVLTYAAGFALQEAGHGGGEFGVGEPMSGYGCHR